MPQFKVDAADPATGETRIVILSANDVADAEKSAKRMGLIVRHVQPYAGEFPMPPAMPAGPVLHQIPPIGQSYHDPKWLTEIRFPLLVSGITNIIASLYWGGGTLGFWFAVGLSSVAVCELRLYGEAPRMPADVLAYKAKKLSYYEMVFGIFNGLSLECGYLMLKNTKRFIATGKQEVPDRSIVQWAKRYADLAIERLKTLRK
jgi:hypothetical protein